jgi:hypothetical protein
LVLLYSHGEGWLTHQKHDGTFRLRLHAVALRRLKNKIGEPSSACRMKWSDGNLLAGLWHAERAVIASGRGCTALGLHVTSARGGSFLGWCREMSADVTAAHRAARRAGPRSPRPGARHSSRRSDFDPLFPGDPLFLGPTSKPRFHSQAVLPSVEETHRGGV